jgi:spore germination protein YaaH
MLAFFLTVAGFLAAVGFGAAPTTHNHVPKVQVIAGTRASAAELGNRSHIGGIAAINLPAASAAPVAAPTTLVDAPPLASREDFAFAPYWTLPQSAGFSLTGLSTLDYFSVGVNPDGSLLQSGPGWNGYQSAALADLITRAHTAGERVVLTVNDFGQSSLDSLTSEPTAPATLAAALIPALQAKNFDGVNFDFEGSGSHDQAGLTNLIATVSSDLRAADPHWQITMDTYASSAGDPGGFYNIPALAPSVDAFFVMAYELNLQSPASSASPLTSGMFSDLTTVEQYTSVVPASKVIVGTPFFGIDWPTNNGTLAAQATGPATDIADTQTQGPNRPQYWDPVTETGWTSYLVGTQWHESYFESPYALFQVALLAAHYNARGVGIWALGMEDNDGEMITALDGFAPPGGPGGTGPTATSGSPPPVVPLAAGATTTTPTPAGPHPVAGPASTTPATVPVTSSTTTTVPAITGVFHGTTRALTTVASGNVDRLLSLGIIYNFTTTDPAFSCLNGKSMTVYLYGALTGRYVAVATTPTDCVTQEFTFPD